MFCPKCHTEIPDGEIIRLCPGCGCDMTSERALLAAKAHGRFLLALGVGVAAMIVCGAIWAAIGITTNTEFGYCAIGIGVAAGFLVPRIAQAHGKAIALVCSVLALFGWMCGKAMLIEYQIYRLPETFAERMTPENIDIAEFRESLPDYLHMQMEKGVEKPLVSKELAEMSPDDPRFAARAAAAFASLVRLSNEAKTVKAKMELPLPEAFASDYLETLAADAVLTARIAEGNIVLASGKEMDAIPDDKDFSQYTPQEQSAFLRHFHEWNTATNAMRQEMRQLSAEAREALFADAIRVNRKNFGLDRLAIYKESLNFYDLFFALIAIYAAWSLGRGKKTATEIEKGEETPAA